MNINMVLSLVRDAAKYIGAGTAGGAIISYFGVDPTQISGALVGVGAIIALGSTLWSQYTNTKAKIVEKAADIVPIPPHVQHSAGVTTPIVAPSNPPKNK